jgi:hypothetical protein
VDKNVKTDVAVIGRKGALAALLPMMKKNHARTGTTIQEKMN